MSTLRKAWALLEQRQRIAAVWLAVLMTIGMILEMAGLGLMVPALTAFAGGLGKDSPTLAKVRELLGNPTNSQFIAIGLLLLLGLYLVKTAFSVLLIWRQSRFVADVQTSLARRLFRNYVMQPWPFHLQRNSAAMVSSIVTEVHAFASAVGAMLSFSTECFVVTGVIALLLYFEPLGAIGVAGVLGAASWIFLAVVQRRLVSWGRRRRDHDIQRTKHLQEGLGGAKEVKLAGRESQFIETFSREARASAAMHSRLMTAQYLPRLWYELMAVAGLALLAGVMALQGVSASVMVAKIGLFGVAAFRVMPSLNRMMLTWQSIRFSDAVIDSLLVESRLAATDPPTEVARRLPFRAAVRLENVTLRYAGATSAALENVTIAIPRGESVGVIGASGAGKSTLVDVLLGLLEPDSGSVVVDESDIQSCLRSWHRCVGYVPQSIYLLDDSIRRNIAFGLADSEIDDAAIERALVAAQLSDFVNSLPDREETLVGERGVRLSGGQRQRIGIARALYHDPPILVLDEATSALDTETETGVMEAVESLHGDKTLVIVAHRLSTVQNCDRLYRLERGRVVGQGSFQEVVKLES